MTPRTIQAVTLAPGGDYAGQWIDRPRLVHGIMFHGDCDITNPGGAPVTISGVDLASLLTVSVNTNLSCGPMLISEPGGIINLHARRRHHPITSDSVTIGAGATNTCTVAVIVPLADYRLPLADGEPEGALWGPFLTDYRVSFLSGPIAGCTLGNWVGQVVAIESDTDVRGSIAAPLVIRSFTVTDAVQRLYGYAIADVIMTGTVTGSTPIMLRDRRGIITDYSTIEAVSFASQGQDDPDYRIDDAEGYCLISRSKGGRVATLARGPLEVQSFGGPWPAGTRVSIGSYGAILPDLAAWLRDRPQARMIGPDGAREADQVRSERAKEAARIARYII